MRLVRLKVGALVAFALVCTVLATPAGSRLNNRQVWNSQHNRDEFEAWAAGLRRVGFSLSGREFQELLWRITTNYLEHRNALLKPLRVLPEQLGFTQSWRMFSNPQTSPSRLWVELDGGSGFEPLFVLGSTQHDWHREFFEHHRIRKLLGRIGRAGRAPEYEALGKWLARKAARDFPAAKALRVSVYTWKTEPLSRPYRSETPPEFGRPGGAFKRRKTFDLAKFRR
jgi:hypothetical protein